MFKQFVYSRRAGIAISFAVSLFPLLAGIGMAMEYANITNHRAKLQNSVDAAILFAGSHLDQTDTLPSEDDVLGFVASNYQGSISAMDFKRTHLGSRLTLEVETEIPAYFFGSMYPDVFYQEISASIPYLAKNYFEIAMVFDNSGSMERNNARVISTTDSRMIGLKAVANDFIDNLISIVDSKNQVHLGLVPYNQHVNVGWHNQFKSWTTGSIDPGEPKACAGGRNAPDTYVDGSISVPFPLHSWTCPLTPISELTELTAASSIVLRSTINSMVGRHYTYIGSGVMWGARVLSPKEPFDEGISLGSLPAHYNHQKVMIVLTDGDNTMSPNVPHSIYNENLTKGEEDVATRLACQEAIDAGVVIFTIVFGSKFSHTGSTAEALLRECAGEDIRYFRAVDAVDLLTAFNSIFAQMTTLRLAS